MELKVKLRAAPEEVADATIISTVSAVFTQGFDALYVDHSPSLFHLLRIGHHRVLNRILLHTHRHTLILHHRTRRLLRHSNRLFYATNDVALGHVLAKLLVRVVQESDEQELDEVCVA